jgi:hypothetical protein
VISWYQAFAFSNSNLYRYEQAAFVLSIPRRRPADETQETLRTSAFPSTHVKEKWAKNLYISAVAFGRTVS